MAMRKIYIARHGERLDFVDKEWYKTAELPDDSPLTALGNEQATELGQKLSTLDVKHVFSSPYSRCVNTASNAAKAISPDLRVNIEPGACEWLNAIWYAHTTHGPVWRDVESLGKEFTNVNRAYQPVFPMSHNFDGFPETGEDIKKRCAKTIRAILETVKSNGNILIVGHGSSVEGFIDVMSGVKTNHVSCMYYARLSHRKH